MKKQAAIIAICAALLICVAAAGCTGSSSSPSASATAHSSSKAATASATVKPTPTVTPLATVKPTPTATVTPTVTPLPSASPSAGGSAGMSVLYFYLPGCPHCAALEASPSFTQLQSKVQVTRISNDQTQLTNQYGVSEFPTLILLNNGYEIGRTVGAEDATAILAQTG